MNYEPLEIIIGVLLRVAEEAEESGDINHALRKVAIEINNGIKLKEDGETKCITLEQAKNGQFIGDMMISTMLNTH